MASRFDKAIAATDRALRTSRPMRNWLSSLRWCGDSIRGTTQLAVRDRAVLSESGTEAIVFFLLLATGPDPGSRPIHLPLSIGSVRLDPGAFELEVDDSTFYVMEAERRESYARFAVDALRRGTKVPTQTGDSLTFRGEGIGAFRGVSPIPGGDTSNVLLRIASASGDIVLKSYKFLDPGNREPEIVTRLQARKFRHAARFLGEVALGRGEDRLVLGMMSEHVEADDVFTWLRDGLRDSFGEDGRPGEDFAEGTRGLASDLGEATAALHEALMDRHPGPWHPEPFTEEDFHDAFKSATRSLGAALRRLALLGHAEEPTVAESARRARAQLLDLRAPIERTLRHLEGNVGGVKTVIHSDLHLAQVLRRRTDAELLFIDFEGEPDRPPSERGRKLPPLRDVGSMVRSFAYVRHFALRDGVHEALANSRPVKPARSLGPQNAMADQLANWETEMVERFTTAYLSRSTLHDGLDAKEAGRMIRGWAMEKALYELEYELKHRVANFPIPLDGIETLSKSSSGLNMN
jgi:maltose alpha-D-glucosyltransferase/alpha-amylase